MDQNTYIRDIYSKYWITASEHKYGFSAYDRNVCRLIAEHVGEPTAVRKCRLLEVAVGTGYPIADALQKTGFEVHGVDLSPLLVARCRELNPLIRAVVGDASRLPYPSADFDAVYCIRSTWFLSNLRGALAEMIRVVKSEGVVVFDIQNRENSTIVDILRMHQWEARGIGCLWRQAKNVVKFVTRKGYPIWRMMVHQVPSYPSDISAYLQECGYNCDARIYARQRDDSLREVNQGESLSEFARLIYVVRKGMTGNIQMGSATSDLARNGLE